MTKNEMKTLIPVFRKVYPGMVAKQLAGVQSMSNVGISEIFRWARDKYYLVEQTVDGLPPPPTGYVTVDVITNIGQWIEQHPISMWKPGDVPAYNGMMDRYTISEELYTLLVLRWS